MNEIIIPQQFQIVIDTREQYPYRIKNAVRGTLKTGDYSILGLESIVAIERKELKDAYHSIGQNHERFRREMERAKDFLVFEIIVETSPEKFVKPFEEAGSLIHTNSLRGTVRKWRQEYGVQWVFLSGIDICRKYVEWRLRRFYDEFVNGLW